ncbi:MULTISPECIES: hypothetical protein [unclassified Clostridium]|uniref:hypothetical protein n=1 Tax=unclassified Clostridium TaxID=2614128 RepID=UPI0025C480B7|nr:MULTISPECIES: hypothetical protein [unclassified Clostridium]
MELTRREDEERLKIHRMRIQEFYKKMNEQFKNNIDEILVDFICENDLDEECDIQYWLRKYSETLKERLIK